MCNIQLIRTTALGIITISATAIERGAVQQILQMEKPPLTDAEIETLHDFAEQILAEELLAQRVNMQAGAQLIATRKTP